MPQFENQGYEDPPPPYNEDGDSKGFEGVAPPPQPEPPAYDLSHNDPLACPQQTHVHMSPHDDLYAGIRPYDNQQHVIVCQPDRTQLVPAKGHYPVLVFPAIFVCLFCCCPIGLFAIHYAHRANELSRIGYLDEAKVMATKSTILTIIGAILGAIGIFCMVLRFTIYFDDSSM